MAKPKTEPYVCYCNFIAQEKVEAAIRRGCQTLPRIFDATQAGVGACGGSCRPFITKMLDSYLKSGEFPAESRPRLPKGKNR